MPGKSKDSLDSIFENFNPVFSHDSEWNPEANKPLTFWLPDEYKAKYDLLQERTKRKFGKLLKEVLKRSIDRVEVEDI